MHRHNAIRRSFSYARTKNRQMATLITFADFTAAFLADFDSASFASFRCRLELTRQNSWRQIIYRHSPPSRSTMGHKYLHCGARLPPSIDYCFAISRFSTSARRLTARAGDDFNTTLMTRMPSTRLIDTVIYVALLRHTLKFQQRQRRHFTILPPSLPGTGLASFRVVFFHAL